MAIQTLTGGEFEAGSAINNTQTDQFNIVGSDNTILEDAGTNGGGNLIVNGLDGLDTATTIMLGDASAVTDTITLDGGGNVLEGPFTPTATLFDSTVTFTVNGISGGNTVNLDNGSDGTTTISLGGANNTVTLNGDATNTVTTGSGSATVTIGSSDDNLFGFTSTVTLAGSDNTVTGGDEDFAVTGGVNKNTISLGDGNNIVSVSGTDNSITVWGGNNTINAGGSGAVVKILGVDGVSAATYAAGADIDDAPVPPSPDRLCNHSRNRRYSRNWRLRHKRL